MSMPLNRDLVKEFYLLIRSYQMMVGQRAPEHHMEVAAIFRSMGGFLINENGVTSYRFYKQSTTQQIGEIRDHISNIFAATLLGIKSGIGVDQIYDKQAFILPVEGEDVATIDTCMVMHAWAALLNANKDTNIFVIVARQPDQDYTLPAYGYQFPLCFPYDLSPDAFKQVVPKQFKHLNVGVVEMTPREMFTYPMWEYEKETR